MKRVSKTIRMDEALARIISERARREHVDESTAARQLLMRGAIDYAADLNHAGNITYREAARLCGLSVRDFLEEMFKRGPPPDRPAAEVEEEMRRVRELVRDSKMKRSRGSEGGSEAVAFLAADRSRKKR